MDESRLLSTLHKENIVPNLSHVSQTLKSSLPCSVKTKRAQWYSPCNSPRPKVPLSPDDNLPILKLNHFEKTPRLLFGSVKLGSSKIEELVVWNPHPIPQTLRVEKVPVKRGFTVNCTKDDTCSLLTLEADEEIVLPIKWEPNESCRCRELIVFKWNETHRLQAIVIGSAIDMKTKKKRRSVLCNSQALNSPKPKKSIKSQFSIITKDPINSQCEFGRSIPLVKEIPQDEERRDTYVVLSTDNQHPEERRETYLVSKVIVKSGMGHKSCIEVDDSSKIDQEAVDYENRPPKAIFDANEGNCVHFSSTSSSKLTPLKQSKQLVEKLNTIAKKFGSRCTNRVNFENCFDGCEEEKSNKFECKESSSRLKGQQEVSKDQRLENLRDNDICPTQTHAKRLPACEELNAVKDEKLKNAQSMNSKWTDTTEEIKHNPQSADGKENNSEKCRILSLKETTSSGNTKPRSSAKELKRKWDKPQVVLPPVAFDVEPTKNLKTAEDKKKKTTAQRNEKKTNKKTRTVKLNVTAKGVAPTRLKLVKPVKTSIPHHPMPFAAKNIYYDERWIEKQEEGFKRWLNFILTPPDESKVNEATSGLLTMSSMKSQPKAPSKEDLSLKTYTIGRKMARLRRCACLLYQSEPVICVIRKIEAEVEHGRLAIRSDKKMHADLGIKKNIVNMILSYNPLWLRIGLETVYGVILPVQSNSDVNGLTRFLTDQMLGNQNIARTYAHPKVPGLFKDGYVEQMSKFTLKKFLFLVLFLDRAKLTRIIDHDPCLFVKDAEFKSSRSLLLSFSRDYLKGEGDITKHLSYLGFSVTHQQRPVDEIDYAVNNIAVDLRDGLRLTRVVELLTHNWQLTQSLRVPAISRLQKIHNVEVFMRELKEHNIPVGDGEGCCVNPRHVVDGHREKTLQLLWLIIFNFQVSVVLNEKQVKEEISFLEQNQSLCHQLTVNLSMLGLPRTKRESLENDIYFKSSRLSLLLKWCKLICRHYGMKVENFTVSFSDGRALCYLLHYYHPGLLPLSMIKQDTTLTRNPGIQENSDDEEEGIVRDSWAASYSPGSGINREIERLKANEKENFKLIAEKVKALGGVPMMTKFSDMSNTIPDEKVVITYTSYLCSRLLDLREETRAARKIQLAWKSHQLRKRLERQQTMNRAAIVIQAYARGAMHRRRHIKVVNCAVTIQSAYRGYKARQRQYQISSAASLIQTTFRATRKMRFDRAEFLRYKKAVVTIQAVYRGQRFRRLLARTRAALVIQSKWRSCKTKSLFLKIKEATIVCQRFVRGKRQREKFIAVKDAALVLQVRYRAFKLQREERTVFLNHRRAAITVQAYCRGYRQRKFLKRVRAAIVIQKTAKMLQQRGKYQLQKQSAITIQSQIRMFLARRSYIKLKHSATAIQKLYRALRIGEEHREIYVRLRFSCIKVQSLWRGYSRRQQFARLKTSATRIQAAVRRNNAQNRFIKLKTSAIKIQQCYRSYRLTKQARNEFQALKSAVVLVQATYRQHRYRRIYIKAKQAIVKTQAIYRGSQQRRRYLRLKKAATAIAERYQALLQGRQQHLLFHIHRGAVLTIQAAIRGFLTRRDLERKIRAATRIQTQFRRYVAKKMFQRVKSAAVIIQERYRSYKAGAHERVKYKAIRRAVLLLQAYFRGRRTRQHLTGLQHAATCIQANYRCFQVHTRYISLKKATMVVQAWYRSAKLTRSAVSDYQATQYAVVLIQSHYRGMLVRKALDRQLKAAIAIQTTYRRHFHQSRYSRLKHATTAIQTRFRAMHDGRSQAKYYQTMKSSAVKIQAMVRMLQAKKRCRELRALICIQSATRGMIVRHEIRKKHFAAISIQTAFRCHIAVNRYKTVQRTALIIQANFRASRQAQKYHKLKASAIQIQACYRGHRSRHYVNQIKAAIVLQSYYRQRTARKQFINTRNAIIFIQASARRFLAVRYYERLRRAVIFMQRRHRANVALLKQYMRYHIQRGACIVLQAALRRHQARKRFITFKNASVTLQRQYRAFVHAREKRTDYLVLKAATITVQSFVRGMFARRLLTQHKAARTIQSCYKMHVSQRTYYKLRRHVITTQATFRMIQQRKHYVTLKKAALTIQSRYRAMRLGRAVNCNFKRFKAAAIMIQRVYRGHIGRQYCRQIRSAIKIQAFFKGYSAKKKFLEYHSSVIVVQSMVRMVQARKKFQKLRHSSVVIQRRYRGSLKTKEQRSQFLLTRRLMIVLQSAVRRWRDCTRFLGLKTAVICIQTRYRATITSRKQRCEFLTLRGSAIVIQAGFRAYKARQLYKKLRAARLIQSYFRMQKTRTEFIAIRKAAIAIQSMAKMVIDRNQFLRLRTAALLCQRKRRANGQCRVQREAYLRFIQSVVLVQSVFRGNVARRQVQRILENQRIANEAAAKIQHFYRGYRHMVQTRLYYHYTRRAAITIQSWYRGIAARRLARHIRSAVVLQAYYRGYRARREYHIIRSSIIKIQGSVRCYFERRRYLALQQSVLLCQQLWRASKLMQVQRDLFSRYRSSVTRIQAVWRGKKERTIYKETVQSIVLDQALIRRFLARRRFLVLHRAIITLQRRYRNKCLTRQTQNNYKLLRNAAKCFQRHYRGHKARKYVHQVISARFIQRQYRAVVQGRLVRVNYLNTRAAIVTIQAAYRGHIGRKLAIRHACARVIQTRVRILIAGKQLQKLREARRQKLLNFASAVWYHLSVIRVQRFYRQVHALAVAKREIFSVISIQRWWRSVLIRRHYQDKRNAALVIQNAMRRRLTCKHRAATKIQALVRAWLLRNNVDKMTRAAITIQAWVRGHQVRSSVRSLKLKTARRRIKAANQAATESMKLCNRTRSALDYLLCCKNLTTIFDVLVNLEVVTRLSYVCCEQLVKDKALEILLAVIRNSNRSLPHMEIVKYALAILINLAKCPTTYRFIYDKPNAISTLLKVVTTFREKDQIFSKACCVLTILARRDDAILQDFKNTPNMVDRVKSAHALTARKYTLEKRRSTVKAKMALGTPYKSQPISQTPFKSHTPYKPRVKSDWATWQEYVNRVQDPLQAVRSLIRTLQIECK